MDPLIISLISMNLAILSIIIAVIFSEENKLNGAIN